MPPFSNGSVPGGFVLPGRGRGHVRALRRLLPRAAGRLGRRDQARPGGPPPGRGRLAVDAKVSLDSYLDALEVEDAANRERLLGAHASSVRQKVKQLADKAYARRVGRSPEMVVMFVLRGGLFRRRARRPEAARGRGTPARRDRQVARGDRAAVARGRCARRLGAHDAECDSRYGKDAPLPHVSQSEDAVPGRLADRRDADRRTPPGRVGSPPLSACAVSSRGSCQRTAAAGRRRSNPPWPDARGGDGLLPNPARSACDRQSPAKRLEGATLMPLAAGASPANGAAICCPVPARCRRDEAYKRRGWDSNPRGT